MAWMLNARTINILVRTAHIAAMGVLLGGHAFDLPRERLLLSLWLTIGTGVALALLEAGPSLLWLHQGRGLMTLAKLGLLCAVPFLWNHWHLRLIVMLAAVAIASIGSHMPARFRYYSVIHTKVIPCGTGPGASQLRGEASFADEPLSASLNPTVCWRCDKPATFHVTNLGTKDCGEVHLCEDHAREYLSGGDA
jgi:hypothetical protein